MRILLIKPGQTEALGSEAGDHAADQSGPYPPLGLMYLQAAAEQSGRHRVDLVDGNIPLALARTISQDRHDAPPGLVGVTALTPNLPSVMAAVATARQAYPGARVVIGGPHTELFAEETATLEGVDYVLPGEGELTLPALADLVQDGQAPDPGVLGPADLGLGPEVLLPPVDELPTPRRDRLVWRLYRGLAGEDVIFATMMSSRGCPHKCTFCSTPRGRWRHRDVDAIVREMEACAALGAQHIYFVDDTFPIAGSRLAALCEELSARPHLPPWSCRTAALGLSEENLAMMLRAGCTRMQIGVETCTPEGLKVLGKRATLKQIQDSFAAARKVGMPTMAYFMIGLPNERTRADVQRTIDFARDLKPDYALFNVLTLYPGTPLLRMAENRGLVAPGLWRDFALDPRPDFEAPIWDEHLSHDQLFDLLDRAYRSFYLRPSVVLSQLRRGGLMSKARAGLRMLTSGGPR